MLWTVQPDSTLVDPKGMGLMIRAVWGGHDIVPI